MRNLKEKFFPHRGRRRRSAPWTGRGPAPLYFPALVMPFEKGDVKLVVSFSFCCFSFVFLLTLRISEPGSFVKGEEGGDRNASEAQK